MVRLLSGAERPTSGRIHREMSVSWPLAFTGAFQANLTGLDNLKFVCRVYGVDWKPLVPFVEDFTELGLYLREPVMHYSTGMTMRLAFALSMAIEFDCFLIDEGLSVGDARFGAPLPRRAVPEAQGPRLHPRLARPAHHQDLLRTRLRPARGPAPRVRRVDAAYEFYEAAPVSSADRRLRLSSREGLARAAPGIRWTQRDSAGDAAAVPRPVQAGWRRSDGLIQSSNLVVEAGLPVRRGRHRWHADRREAHRSACRGSSCRCSKAPRRIGWSTCARRVLKLFRPGGRRASPSLFGHKVALGGFDPTHFKDFIWRDMFAKTLPIEDFRGRHDAGFRILRWPWSAMHAIGVVDCAIRRALLRPLDTRGHRRDDGRDALSRARREATQMVVRYHDAIPLLMPHTIKNRRLSPGRCTIRRSTQRARRRLVRLRVGCDALRTCSR